MDMRFELRRQTAHICIGLVIICLLYTSDAADEGLGVDLDGSRIIKKKTWS